MSFFSYASLISRKIIRFAVYTFYSSTLAVINNERFPPSISSTPW